MPAKPKRQPKNPYLSVGHENAIRDAEQLLLEVLTHPDQSKNAIIYRLERVEDTMRSILRETRWREM